MLRICLDVEWVGLLCGLCPCWLDWRLVSRRVFVSIFGKHVQDGFIAYALLYYHAH